MIQFNLLPDVKLTYIKAQRTKHFVTTVSLLVGAASLAIFAVLVLTVDVWQKKTISDLSKDITSTSKQLKDVPDLNKILTVQSQLGQLTTLHDKKPAAQRLFGYLSQITPNAATISDMTISFTDNTLSITGNAPSLDIVNTFTDGLKFTTYQLAGSTEEKKPFSSVVLTSFARGDAGATYTITAEFDPIIFDNTETATLSVPNIVTTRSVIEQPSVLFNETGN